MCIIQGQGGVRRRSDSCDLDQEILNLNTLITLYQPQTLEVSFIDPLQLTSSIREYAGIRAGTSSWWLFSVFGDSSFYGDLTIVHQKCF